MKLLILNTYDSMGGAAIATYRLHRSLRAIGLDSRLMVMYKSKNDPSVIVPAAQGLVKRAVRYLYARRDERIARICQAGGNRYFSPARCPDQLSDQVDTRSPDLIHLSWINSGFMKIETLAQFKKPIVWTLHDMWPFTGGCHYDEECGRFQQGCGKCPILNSDRDSDLSHQIWERKQQSWSKIPVVIVAASQWLAAMAQASSLFKNKRIEVIPNGIDTERYKPIEKKTAREAFSLPQDKKFVLFCAFSATTDKRKGHHLLVPALQKLSNNGWRDKTELVIIGASEPENPPDLGMKVHYIEHLHDEISMALLYSAVDVTVAPSMQENLSNAVMESLSCGTPVVAFKIGGMPDMIVHEVNGYLATPFDEDDLAAGIAWVLVNNERHAMLSEQARSSVEKKYALMIVGNQYLALYQDILK